MEMGSEELEEEVSLQEKSKTTKSMEDRGVNIERPTCTMTEVVPQELASTVELAEQINNTTTTEEVPQ